MFCEEKCELCPGYIDLMSMPRELAVLADKHPRCCVPCLKALKAAAEQKGYLKGAGLSGLLARLKATTTPLTQEETDSMSVSDGVGEDP